MTDYEKVKSLFKELRIGYKETEEKFGKQIRLRPNENENVEGLTFCVTYFYFDHNEKSAGVSIHEEQC